MFLNKKRLLLTLYRLEEGQQDILQRLERLERKGVPQTAENVGQEDDKWLLSGMEAILSYRRNPKEETK